MKLESIAYLESKKTKFKVIHLKEVPKTAKDVERIYGCPLHSILKTLIFTGDKNVLAVLPGDEKVDLNKLSRVTKTNNLKLATPEEVKQLTGYSIGGVTPFCVKTNLVKVVDKSFKDSKTINVGSGEAIIGLEMDSKEFAKAFDGKVEDIKQ